MFTFKGIYVFYSLAIWCYDNAAGADNPATPANFLPWLLNTTTSDLREIASKADFITVDPRNVKFLLHQPDGADPVELHSGNQHLIDGTKKVKIIIHGWTNNGTLPWILEMGAAFIERGFTAISVDWSVDAARDYLYSSTAVKAVGDIAGGFIADAGLKLQDLHVLGHSLGAHVAGFVGKKLIELGLGQPDRITGFDPAAPLFETVLFRENAFKLYKSDAKFVDIIHTNILLFGVAGDYGHVDFYPNSGGPIQPGCMEETSPTQPFESVSCSHQKVHVYYHQSILEPEKFKAVSCVSDALYKLKMCDENPQAFMGEQVSRNATGTYYLVTDN